MEQHYLASNHNGLILISTFTNTNRLAKNKIPYKMQNREIRCTMTIMQVLYSSSFSCDWIWVTTNFMTNLIKCGMANFPRI